MFALFDEMIARDIEPDDVVCNVMVDAYLKEGNWIKALMLVDDILLKGVNVSKIMYNVLIDALCKYNNVSEVLKLLDEIEEQGLKLSLSTCRTLVSSFHRAGRTDEAVKALESMVRFKWVPDSVVLSDLINGDEMYSENADDFSKQTFGVACQVQA